MIDFIKGNKAIIAVVLTVILVLGGIIWIESVDKPENQTVTISTAREPVKETETPNPTELPTASPETVETAVPTAEPMQEVKTEKSTGYYLGEEAVVTAAPVNDKQPSCTIAISCKMLFNNMDRLDREKVELIPDNGWILPMTEVILNEGESVFDILQRATKENKLHLEFVKTPVYNSAYIEGIHNLYEFDCGELSGWIYSVNGEFPSYGCSRYTLKDGDSVVWHYTCNLGRDVSGKKVSQADE